MVAMILSAHALHIAVERSAPIIAPRSTSAYRS